MQYRDTRGKAEQSGALIDFFPERNLSASKKHHEDIGSLSLSAIKPSESQLRTQDPHNKLKKNEGATNSQVKKEFSSILSKINSQLSKNSSGAPFAASLASSKGRKLEFAGRNTNLNQQNGGQAANEVAPFELGFNFQILTPSSPTFTKKSLMVPAPARVRALSPQQQQQSRAGKLFNSQKASIAHNALMKKEGSIQTGPGSKVVLVQRCQLRQADGGPVGNQHLQAISNSDDDVESIHSDSSIDKEEIKASDEAKARKHGGVVSQPMFKQYKGKPHRGQSECISPGQSTGCDSKSPDLWLADHAEAYRHFQRQGGFYNIKSEKDLSQLFSKHEAFLMKSSTQCSYFKEYDEESSSGTFKLSQDGTKILIVDLATKSTQEIYLESIRTFAIGGFSSRFFDMRKELNSARTLTSSLMKSWECLTLSTNSRDIDLVIESSQAMRAILVVLIFRLRTMDGARGSLDDLVYNKLESVYEKQRHSLSEQALEKAIEKKKLSLEAELYRKALFKYRLIVIRQKLSYQAFISESTVLEIVLKQILATHQAVQAARVPSSKIGKDVSRRLTDQPKAFNILSPGLVSPPKMKTTTHLQQFEEPHSEIKIKTQLQQNINNQLARNTVKGADRIMLLLKRIQLSKEILIAQARAGRHVHLSKDLRTNHLPQSFRFYCVRRMLNKMIAEDGEDDHLLLKLVKIQKQHYTHWTPYNDFQDYQISHPPKRRARKMATEKNMGDYIAQLDYRQDSSKSGAKKSVKIRPQESNPLIADQEAEFKKIIKKWYDRVSTGEKSQKVLLFWIHENIDRLYAESTKNRQLLQDAGRKQELKNRLEKVVLEKRQRRATVQLA